MDQDYTGIVLYTDGGARPNPGFGGFGAHGYIYTTKSLKSLGKSSPSGQIITTHGYVNKSRNNEEAEERIINVIQFFDLVGSLPSPTTNNHTEVLALATSLRELQSVLERRTPEDIEELGPLKTIRVYTDSAYLEKGVNEWAPICKSRNWKTHDGRPIANAETWQSLMADIDGYRELGIDFKIGWVRGHAGNIGNHVAHLLASIGINRSRDNIHETIYHYSDPDKYWNCDIDRNPMISYQRLYFNALPEYNREGHYYIGNPGEDDSSFGERSPLACYAVVKLKSPDQLIEMIKDRVYHLATGINAIMAVRLDRLYNRAVYPYLSYYGPYALEKNNRDLLSLNFVDSKPIADERNPPGLSWRAVQCFGFLEDLLDQVSHLKSEGKELFTANPRTAQLGYQSLQIIDMTDHFFAGGKLKKDFIVGMKKTLVPIHLIVNGNQTESTIPLLLGYDLPTRNHLKQMESEQIKIQLVIWSEAPTFFRYASLIEGEEGYGIWINYHSNQHCFIKGTIS